MLVRSLLLRLVGGEQEWHVRGKVNRLHPTKVATWDASHKKRKRSVGDQTTSSTRKKAKTTQASADPPSQQQQQQPTEQVEVEVEGTQHVADPHAKLMVVLEAIEDGVKNLGRSAPLGHGPPQ